MTTVRTPQGARRPCRVLRSTVFQPAPSRCVGRATQPRRGRRTFAQPAYPAPRSLGKHQGIEVNFHHRVPSAADVAAKGTEEGGTADELRQWGETMITPAPHRLRSSIWGLLIADGKVRDERTAKNCGEFLDTGDATPSSRGSKPRRGRRGSSVSTKVTDGMFRQSKKRDAPAESHKVRPMGRATGRFPGSRSLRFSVVKSSGDLPSTNKSKSFHPYS